MNPEEIKAAEEAAILSASSAVLETFDGRKIDHCIAGALSAIGTVISQHPEYTVGFASSLHKLADHLQQSMVKH